MGIVDRIKQVFGNRDRRAQNRILTDRQKEIDDQISELQQKIAELQDQKTRLESEFKAKAQECVRIGKDDPRFATLRREGMTIGPRIKALEQNIQRFDAALQNLAKYRAMIETGVMTQELEALQPDADLAGATLATITDRAEALVGSIQDMSDTMQEFEQKLSASAPTLASEPDPFDTLLSEMSAPAAAPAAVDPFDAMVAGMAAAAPAPAEPTAAAVEPAVAAPPAAETPAAEVPPAETPAEETPVAAVPFMVPSVTEMPVMSEEPVNPGEGV